MLQHELPSAKAEETKVNSIPLNLKINNKEIFQLSGGVNLEFGSGKYHFQYPIIGLNAIKY
jgi:hypothetical protein